MAFKSLISFFIIYSSFLHVALSQTSAADLLQTLAQAAHEGSVQCMQKLLPCQHYLKNSSDPSLTCCSPLKEMIANGTQCLCKSLNDPEFLQSVNVTRDDAFKLTKACGLDAKISICHKGIFHLLVFISFLSKPVRKIYNNELLDIPHNCMIKIL